MISQQSYYTSYYNGSSFWALKYSYCSNNPLIRIDPDGEDDYETDAVSGKTTVVRTEDKTNTYRYKSQDGTIYNLGTYDKEGDKVKLNEKTSFYEQPLYDQGNTYVGGDEAAALLSAMYSYYEESGKGEPVKINQMMSEDNKHSGVVKNTQCVDIQYVSTDGRQGDTRKGNVDYNRSQALVDKLRFFGFNDRGDGWNILTASGDNKSAALKGTHLYNKSEHRHHMHLQGFNKTYINEKKK